MSVLNTWFEILKADETGEMVVMPSSRTLKRSQKLPFTLKVWFESMLGEEVKMVRWTEGEEEVTVIGRGGKLNHRANV